MCFPFLYQKVKDVLVKDSKGEEKGTMLEDDHEYYKLILDCNHLLVDIDKEIVIFHNFIRDKYRVKFRELESLLQHPIDYARVVKKIGNETDLARVDLRDLLPSSIVMVVSVTALTTKGNPLPEDVLRKMIEAVAEEVEACDRALDLDTARKKILDFVESKMSGSIAPILSAVVGSDVAAKIVCEAGGLSALAKMPPCNVQLLGQRELLGHKKRKNLAGFSTVTRQYSHVRFIERTYMFQTTPPGLRTRASRLLAAKSTLAARVDATREDPSGTKGKAFRDEISKKIKKWQESSPTMELKPLMSTWKETLFGLFQ
ncbi:unnamed protein product [Cochlearia groenlandica]